MSVQLPRRARLSRDLRVHMGGRGVAVSYAPVRHVGASGLRSTSTSVRLTGPGTLRGGPTLSGTAAGPLRLRLLSLGAYVVPAAFILLALYLVFR